MSQQRTRQALCVFITALIFTLVWLWPCTPVPAPDPATAEALEAAAEKWWGHGGPPRQVPEAEWPLELRRLGPKTVRVTPEGVFITFGSLYVEEWGLFVLPKRSDYRPQQGTDPSFRVLWGRVYRYDITG